MFQSEEENGLLKPRKLLCPGLQGGVVERCIVALPNVLFTLDRFEVSEHQQVYKPVGAHIVVGGSHFLE